MRIGIDFDNTIAGYDHVFAQAAADAGLLADGVATNKKEVRAALRKLTDGEISWQRLQGEVYGARMSEAKLIEGVASFFVGCHDVGLDVFIISHKTNHNRFDPEQVNLRIAATLWMETHQFFDEDGLAVPRKNLYFEETRADKIARIADLRCTHFIDDLEEVFREAAFPNTVTRYLFSPDTVPLPQGPFRAFSCWHDIESEILSGIRRTN